MHSAAAEQRTPRLLVQQLCAHTHVPPKSLCLCKLPSANLIPRPALTPLSFTRVRQRDGVASSALADAHSSSTGQLPNQQTRSLGAQGALGAMKQQPSHSTGGLKMGGGGGQGESGGGGGGGLPQHGSSGNLLGSISTPQTPSTGGRGAAAAATNVPASRVGA